MPVLPPHLDLLPNRGLGEGPVPRRLPCVAREAQALRTVTEVEPHQPLPQEVGIDWQEDDASHIDTLVELWSKLGLHLYPEDQASVSIDALCYVDTTDWTAQREQWQKEERVPAPPVAVVKKPWWRFW